VSDDEAELLWQLAVAATRLRAHPDTPSELVEATAALQDLAIQLVGAEDKAARLAEL
jgi:hypothetical protein